MNKRQLKKSLNKKKMVNVALASTDKKNEAKTAVKVETKVTKKETCNIKAITKKQVGEFITTKEEVVPSGSELLNAGAYALNGEVVFFANVNTNKENAVVASKEYDTIVYFTEEVNGWVSKNAEKTYTKKDLVDVIYTAVNTMIEEYNVQ
ncbi:hypothetical protein [Anaerosporobacter sp.]|uniref:hypothetical protein n=1 Tax=Anaerosporobacter sp. TaxID=1872529 RepID=UPI00286F2FC4|nr:hypothetical protein [Anaerosporobacter sp.]